MTVSFVQSIARNELRLSNQLRARATILGTKADNREQPKPHETH
jgi:hypothetical protein